VPDISAELNELKRQHATGCLTVVSPWHGTAHVFLLFGEVTVVASPDSGRPLPLAEVLQWNATDATFESNRLPPHANPASPDTRRAHWILRSCAVGAILFFLLPPIVIGITGWSFLKSLGPQAATKAKYQALSRCSPGSDASDCYTLETGTLLSLSRVPGNCSHTDQLSISLGDGVHQVDVYFSCMQPYVWYANARGRVTVKRYGGEITAVQGIDGRMYETTDSPGETNWAAGIFAGAIALMGAPILIGIFFLVKVPGLPGWIWQLLRNGEAKDISSKAA
jgi:hypothetical protein